MPQENHWYKSKNLFYQSPAREILITIGSIFFYAAFHTPINTFLADNISTPFLAQAASTRWIDLGLLLLVFFLTYTTFRRYGKVTPSNKITVALTVVTLIYLYYRISNSTWEFTPISLFPRFKYMDVIPVALYLRLLLHVKVQKEEKVTTKHGFIEDTPVGNPDNDELGYKNYAATIAQKIKATYPKQAFAIGINGKWGLGKTSFFNFIKERLKDDDEIIEINFSPWNSHSPDAIITDFFETFQQAVKPYSSSLARELHTYSGKLVSVQNNILTQSIQFVTDALNGFEPVGSLRKDIDTALQKIDKKIVVYIDDIDRLDKKETMEVIRLIRNTANFSNTFFIVAYDRNYVVNAIKEHNSHNQETFLEKIIQLEITLPLFKNSVLKEKLAEKLKEKFPDLQEEIDKEAEVNQSLEIWIENIRDTTRLVNSLSVSIEKLRGEVVFGDLLDIELLKLKYPSVYEILHKQRKQFLYTNSQSSDKSHFQLKEVKPPSELLDEKTIKFEFELYLYRNYETLSIPKKEIKKINLHVHNIFGGNLRGIHYYRKNRHTSVIYPSKFERYFAYGLLDDNLSEVDFSIARAGERESFKQKIDEWVSNKLQTELLAKFKMIDSFDDREDFEKIIEGIFFLGNQNSQSTNYSFSILNRRHNLVGYDASDLAHKLYNENDKVSKAIYGGSSSEYKKFIKSLFENASRPYIFESYILHDLNTNPILDSLPISQEEIENLNIRYFSDCINNTSKLDSVIWFHYHNCEQTIWEPAGGNSRTSRKLMPQKANELMKDFVIQTDFNGFLLSIIELNNRDKNEYCLSRAVEKMFGTWEDFTTVILNMDENKNGYLPEFKAFLEKFADKEYKFNVPFEFKDIPVKKY